MLAIPSNRRWITTKITGNALYLNVNKGASNL
jgi:hypothetical protein